MVYKGCEFDNEQFGRSLTFFRLDRGVTQKVLADYLHCTQQYVSQLENGLSYPDIFLLLRVLDFFNLSLDDYLNCIGSESGSSIPNNSFGVIR